MVEARNLGSKLIVHAFIRLSSSARGGRVLPHVVRFVIKFEEWVNFEIIVGIPFLIRQ